MLMNIFGVPVMEHARTPHTTQVPPKRKVEAAFERVNTAITHKMYDHVTQADLDLLRRAIYTRY